MKINNKKTTQRICWALLYLPTAWLLYKVGSLYGRIGGWVFVLILIFIVIETDLYSMVIKWNTRVSWREYKAIAWATWPAIFGYMIFFIIWGLAFLDIRNDISVIWLLSGQTVFVFIGTILMTFVPYLVIGFFIYQTQNKKLTGKYLQPTRP